MADPIITKTIQINAEPISPVKNPQQGIKPQGAEEHNATVNERPEVNPYENIVSVSDDGDTVQVKPEANERLSDGFVFNKTENKEDKNDEEKSAKELVNGPVSEEKEKAQAAQEETTSKISEEKEDRLHEMIKDAVEKTDEAKEAVKESNERFSANEEADKKAAEKNAAVSSNYGTVSDSELERMYLTGQITSYDYNREMESRKEEEESRSQDNSNVTDNVAGADSALKNNEMLENSIRSGVAGEGYETKEEQEAVKDALYGTSKEKEEQSPANFEINIVK